MGELGLTQREVVERSGVSPRTLYELRTGVAGRRRQATTLAAVSRSLGWPGGHLASVLRGDEGGISGNRPTDLGELAEQLETLRSQVRDAVDRMGRPSDEWTNEVTELRAGLERLNEVVESAELGQLRAEVDDLRRELSALHAHLIDLYGRVGQPYPREDTSGDAKERGTRSRRRA
jgi:transcriptional regulator with XRE-family HTH domain